VKIAHVGHGAPSNEQMYNYLNNTYSLGIYTLSPMAVNQKYHMLPPASRVYK
jgi:hypothetical protein